MKQKTEDKSEEVKLEAPEVLEGEECPFCHEKTLILTEIKKEIPYFGKCFIFSMTCENCKYHKSDIEAEENKEPCRYTL